MSRLLTLALAIALLAVPRGAAASPQADAFGGRIPPVSGRLYSKAGKLELTPVANVSLNDAFFSKYLFGAKAGWHLSEYFSLSGAFVSGLSRANGSTTVCEGNEGCRPAAPAQLYQVPGYVKSVGAVELAFSPIYGKVNAFAEKVIHFDLSLIAGADWIRHREVLSAVAANAGEVPGTRSAIGGHFGVGARVYFLRFMALRLEVKDVVYGVPVLGATKVQHQLFTEMGVSLFLPR